MHGSGTVAKNRPDDGRIDEVVTDLVGQDDPSPGRRRAGARELVDLDREAALEEFLVIVLASVDA